MDGQELKVKGRERVSGVPHDHRQRTTDYEHEKQDDYASCEMPAELIYSILIFYEVLC